MKRIGSLGGVMRLMWIKPVVALAITVLAPVAFADKANVVVPKRSFVKSNGSLDLICFTSITTPASIAQKFATSYELELYYDENSKRVIDVETTYIENSGRFYEDLVYKVKSNGKELKGCEAAATALRFLDSGDVGIEFRCQNDQVLAGGAVRLVPGEEVFAGHLNRRVLGSNASIARNRENAAEMHCEFSSEEE